MTQSPWTDRDDLRITSVRAIVTAPEGIPLVVVKVETSDDGLYGLGCATFTQRWPAVVAAVDQCVAPLVIGRHPADIEDLTRAVYYSSYWRNGPVLNNALSGLDMALWDIAGKRHGVTREALAEAFTATGVEPRRVRMHHTYGLVDVPRERADEAVAALTGSELAGRTLNVELAREQPAAA
jgi:mannonate dehydratase